MKMSKALELYIKDHSDFLEDPESYFGPNWATVLNYWAFLDKLSHSQKEKVYTRYCKIRNKSDDVFVYYREATGKEKNGNLSQYTEHRLCFAMPVYEIIGMHLLLDNGIPLVYVKMFDDL